MLYLLSDNNSLKIHLSIKHLKINNSPLLNKVIIHSHPIHYQITLKSPPKIKPKKIMIKNNKKNTLLLKVKKIKAITNQYMH